MTDFLQENPGGVILVLDQMSLYFQATLTRVWAPVGQTPIVSMHPQRDQVYFYGAVNLRDSREIALSAPETTSEMTSNFLMLLLLLYPQPILRLLDRAHWDLRWLLSNLVAQTDRLQALYFPPACPDLNPQAHVWERTRDAISYNHTYRQFQPLIDDFETYLNETVFSTNFMNTFSPLGLGVF